MSIQTITYTLATAAQLAEVQAGRDGVRLRRESATWDEIGRDLIRPTDLSGFGTFPQNHDIGEHGRILSKEEAVAEFRRLRLEAIRNAEQEISALTSAPVSEHVIVTERTEYCHGVRYTTLHVHHDSPTTTKIDSLVSLCSPELAGVLLQYCDQVRELRDSETNRIRSVNESAANEARAEADRREVDRLRIAAENEARVEARNKLLSAWLVRFDHAWADAVAEGTVSASGVLALLEEHLRSIFLASGWNTISDDADILGKDETVSECALPRRLAQDAAKIKMSVRSAVESASGRVTQWKPERVVAEGEFGERIEGRTILICFEIPIPGADGEFLCVGSRIIMDC